MFTKGGYQTYIIKMFRNRKWEQEFLCYQWLNVHEGVACWNFFFYIQESKGDKSISKCLIQNGHM